MPEANAVNGGASAASGRGETVYVILAGLGLVALAAYGLHALLRRAPPTPQVAPRPAPQVEAPAPPTPEMEPPTPADPVAEADGYRQRVEVEVQARLQAAEQAREVAIRRAEIERDAALAEAQQRAAIAQAKLEMELDVARAEQALAEARAAEEESRGPGPSEEED